MKFQLPRQLKGGFSLLELLLVLIVATGIIFLGINRYQIYRRDKDIAAVRENIDLLSQATNTYYHLNCRASMGSNFTVSVDDLKKAGLLEPPNLIPTSLVKSINDYQVFAKYLGQTQTTQKPIYQLLSSVTLNVPVNTMLWYQQILNASEVSGNQLTWNKLPSYIIPSTESGLWIMNSGLRQFKEATTLQATGDDTCAY